MEGWQKVYLTTPRTLTMFEATRLTHALRVFPRPLARSLARLARAVPAEMEASVAGEGHHGAKGRRLVRGDGVGKRRQRTAIDG